jgi:hypothetical protein
MPTRGPRKTRRPFVGARARRRKTHAAALGCCAVGRFEVVEQHAPRHAVDDHVMNREI